MASAHSSPLTNKLEGLKSIVRLNRALPLLSDVSPTPMKYVIPAETMGYNLDSAENMFTPHIAESMFSQLSGIVAVFKSKPGPNRKLKSLVRTVNTPSVGGVNCHHIVRPNN